MIQYTYDFEIQTMVTMFMNAMSDIVIKRFNVHKTTQDQIKTRIVYAPKQRVLADLLDKDQNLQLPVMAVSIGGIARDPSRVFNKILGTFNTNSAGTAATNEKMPLPIDLTLNVSLMTKFQSDMDQLLTHLLPYLNPYFVVSWRTPSRPDFEIRSNILWSGNANIQYPIDLNATTIARVVADLSFTFKGWLFQAVPEDTIGTIITINTEYNNTGVKSFAQSLLDNDKMLSSTPGTDYAQYDGAPPQPKVVEPYYTYVNKLQEFTAYGSGLLKVKNVYLSGAPLSAFSTIFNPFSAVPTLSAEFPPINAVRIPSGLWRAVDNDVITFVMPSAATIPGNLELIIENPAGYGKLTENVRLGTFNPFEIGTPEYDNYTPFQLPFLSGIQVYSTGQ